MDDKFTNNKQSLKNQRVKSYFIKATKELILKDGVENVSVRKVADLAGYTFTTLYNYFTDLNALLNEVKDEMIADLMSFMQSQSPDGIYDLADIKRMNRLYMNYFLERPHIFRFFYSYRLQPADRKEQEVPDYSRHYLATYQGFVDNGTLSEAEVPIIAKTLIYAMHGLLALYFSDNGMPLEMGYQELDQITEYLLKGR